MNQAICQHEEKKGRCVHCGAEWPSRHNGLSVSEGFGVFGIATLYALLSFVVPGVVLIGIFSLLGEVYAAIVGGVLVVGLLIRYLIWSLGFNRTRPITSHLNATEPTSRLKQDLRRQEEKMSALERDFREAGGQDRGVPQQGPGASWRPMGRRTL